MKVETVSNTIPLMKDVLQQLEDAIFHVIDELKKYYSKNDTNLMYITILQGNMISPIRSAGINLQKSDKKAIVLHLMSMFSKFLNSNEHLRLDNTFKVYFKIFSPNHVFDKNSRRKTHLITTLGNFNSNGQMLKGCLYLKSDFQNMFADSCILTSTLMGFCTTIFIR